MAKLTTRNPVMAAVQPRRVLFVRVGSMTYYAGPQAGDEGPKGGGEYNKKNVGHEIFNFAQFDENLYGFARAKNGRVNLKRIDPAAGNVDKLDDVLVIVVAKQRIVGWYRAALVHGTRQPFPVAVAKEMKKRLKLAAIKRFSLAGYQFEAAAPSGWLLPTYERRRQSRIPVKGGFGRSNVCYLYGDNGKRKAAPWMDEAIGYVLGYGKENLLTDPYAEASSEQSAVIAEERAAGFQSDAAIRRAIEDYAMQKAREALQQLGYTNFINTSAAQPYDYTCAKDNRRYYVEVKGTQTRGANIIVTKNEVRHVTNNPLTSILVIIHSVRISSGTRVNAGTAVIRAPWRLMFQDLTAFQYIWALK